ncbi:hypothetical protein BDU57DRAFT_449258 [Ampelomyces quisqualis]|uniref:Uncharacterized protein n=1 Tax=Ampelomyces quisqualis TaxID=50730 RepID=A0A6A5QLI4_AMPQU|nr:hypothetical protein BDU57DRAFT_449258 [Ampelomyces quisqualis]
MEHTAIRDTVDQVQVEEAQWHVQPRDIDIHARGQAPSERPGRLTVISEEEQSVGGRLTRRRRADHSRSGESGVSRIDLGSQGRREEGFLECLVP